MSLEAKVAQLEAVLEQHMSIFKKMGLDPQGGTPGNTQESDIITMNVGGAHFETSRGTLAGQEARSREPNNILSIMVSDRWSSQKRDPNGAFFIDRDPTHFQTILNYMRDMKAFDVNNLPDNAITLSQIQAEADYYGLTSLVNDLKDRDPQYQTKKERLIQKRAQDIEAACKSASEARPAELQNKDLTGGSFAGLAFRDRFDARAVEAKGAHFRDTSFARMCIFQGAQLRGADFSRARFQEFVDFKGANLDECNFEDAEFKGKGDFTGASLRGANLSHVHLTQQIFSRFDRADLRGTKFSSKVILHQILQNSRGVKY